MRLSTCENPRYIKNPYTGDLVRSSCGNCPSCMNLRAKKWVNNLDCESRMHKFTYMVNLTYNQENVPTLMYCDDDPNFIEFSNRDGERIPLSELVALSRDYNGDIIQKDIDYLEERLAHPLGLPCIYTRDISNFFKRINKYCFKHITHHYENFRYFCAHEYGPTTYRCHAHLLVWFDDDAICKRFEEALSACWTFGDCSASAVYSDGGRRYVAQYVNSLVHLPSFYSHPKIRQRIQFSKFPSVGSFDLLDSEVRRLYDELPVRRSVFNSRSGKFNDIPIQSSIKSRFFPKLEGYSKLSNNERVVLYGTCFLVPASSFEEFKDSLSIVRWKRFRQVCDNCEAVISSYYDTVYETIRGVSLKRGYSEFELNKAFDRSLYRWFCISKRIVFIAQSLGVSLNWLVSRIEEFYLKCDYYNLKEFYSWQSDYVSFHGKLQDLLSSYPEFYYYCYKHIKEKDFFSLLSYSEQMALMSFGIRSSKDFVDLVNTYDYNAMKQSSLKIYKDSHKAHTANRYLFSKNFEYSDSKLQDLIIRYKYA